MTASRRARRYATLAPLYSGGSNPTGGNFWDGRATGHVLGNPAADQALGPFLNPAEQGLPDEACVVYRMKNYGTMYTAVWGSTINEITFPDAIVVESICTNTALPVGRHVALSDADRLRLPGTPSTTHAARTPPPRNRIPTPARPVPRARRSSGASRATAPSAHQP